jgi:hypothetical protein
VGIPRTGLAACPFFGEQAGLTLANETLVSGNMKGPLMGPFLVNEALLGQSNGG